MLFSLQGLPPFLKLDFGLCARVFSAVFLPLEPTIHFSNWSAVSPSKSRDFPEPTIPFPTGQRFPKSRDFRLHEPTIPFFNWSAVSHPTSGHDVILTSKRGKVCHTVPHYYSGNFVHASLLSFDFFNVFNLSLINIFVYYCA